MVILEVEVHASVPVIVTVYVPGVVKLFTLVEGVVPPFQKKVSPPLAITFIEGVAQVNSNVPVLLVIFAIGKDKSLVIMMSEVEVHPLVPVTVTVYVSEDVKLFTEDAGEFPPDQAYVSPPDAVTLIFGAIQVSVVVPELLVILATGEVEFCVISILKVAVQPLAGVTVTA